jgi:catechol 2,3-dioxygenase-like lactoylglutathione lyase family enzyme
MRFTSQNARERTVSVQVTAIMLGVTDLSRARKFYAEGLDCAIDKDYPGFVSFSLGPESSSLGLYEREAAAQDAGVSAEGSGFRGVSFHFIVGSGDQVDEIMSNAASAGGAIVKPAAAAQWGGYFGYFSDPDGYLWKVATSA